MPRANDNLDPTRLTDPAGRAYLDAATRCLASSGLRGFSLRIVAQQGGGSLGSLSYRFGSRADLLEKVIEREIEERAVIHRRWQTIVSDIDLSVPQSLASVISAYIDEIAVDRRSAALASAELLIGASLAPQDFPAMSRLLALELAHWQSMLSRGHGPLADLFASAITGYILDELPFAIACAGQAGYRLLRAATIERLACGFADRPAALAKHFDQLVAACGIHSVEEKLWEGIPPGSRKAELAGHIASVLAEQGLIAVTHRAVAARAGVPNSTIAHHFRTREDLFYAGISVLSTAVRSGLGAAEDVRENQFQGIAIIRATHMAALVAARDPLWIPFALDMRRWRATNVRHSVGKQLGLDPQSDGAAIQAAVISWIGCRLMSLAADGAAGIPKFSAKDMAAIRKNKVKSDI